MERGWIGNVSQDPEGRYAEEHGPYKPGVNKDGRGRRGPEGSQPTCNEGIRKERQRENREWVVPERIQRAAVEKLVHGPQAAAAGAVVAGQAQEGTDGVVARLPGVEDVQNRRSAEDQEARDCIDAPCRKSVPLH